jgi:hypothetical protein
LFLRLAVIIGVFAALLGVAGLVIAPPGAHEPPASPRVVVRGRVASAAAVEVHAEWTEAGTAFRERLPRAGEGRWVLPVGVPAGTRVRVRALDVSVAPPRELGGATWSAGDGDLPLDLGPTAGR